MLRFPSFALCLFLISSSAPIVLLAQEGEQHLLTDPSMILGQWEYQVSNTTLSQQALLSRGLITILEGPSGLHGQLQEIPINPAERTNTLRRPKTNTILIKLTDVQYSNNVLTFEGETGPGVRNKMKINAKVKVTADEFEGLISIWTSQNDWVTTETRSIEAARRNGTNRSHFQSIGD